jgi:hypothetical protein
MREEVCLAALMPPGKPTEAVPNENPDVPGGRFVSTTVG